MHCFLFVLVGCAIGVSGDTKLWRPIDVPNPQRSPTDCGQSQPSNICDPNSYLTNDEVRLLEREIENVKNRTECLCSDFLCSSSAGGAKIAIAIVSEMMTPEEDKGEPKPKFDLDKKLHWSATFSQYLHTSWGIDQCNDGILIFYSDVDHVLFTHTASDISKILTNHQIAEISMKHRGNFNEGLYFDGFVNIIRDYKAVLQGRYKSSVYDPQPQPNAQLLVEQSSASRTYVTASLLMMLVTLALHFF